MRKVLSLSFGICLLVGVDSLAVADPAARAIVEKALRASEGVERSAPPKALQSKLKGTLWINGAWRPMTLEGWIQLPSQMKTVLRCDVGGREFLLVQVVNGNRAWRSENGQTQESKGPALTELQEGLHDQRVGLLFPVLDEKSYTLSMAGQSMVNDRPALGVRVSSPGHEDITLYFDRTTGLLVKSERRTPDLTGKEIFRETFFGYKDINGKKELATMAIHQDRVKIGEAEITDVKYPDKIDEREFAPP